MNEVPSRPALEFAKKLREAMDSRGMSASGLARIIWGDAPPTAKGYVSAKNRDRISKYLASKTMPDAATLRLLAKALRVPERALTPRAVGLKLERVEHPEIQLTVIEGHHDRVHLTINTVVTLRKATQIIELVYRNEKDEAPDHGGASKVLCPPARASHVRNATRTGG